MSESLGLVVVLRETDKSLYVRLEELGGELWVPKSVIDEETVDIESEGDTGEIFVEGWFAQKEGLV